MKKKIYMMFGLLFLGLVLSGCGKDTPEENTEEVHATVVPVEPVAPEKEKDLVEMQKIDPVDAEDLTDKNVIGEKTETALQTTIINKTGSEISRIYIRINEDDAEWGDDLIDDAFVLKNGEEAIYFQEKDKETRLYDIRISYTDYELSECFFRKLPLNEISSITLCMADVGNDTIPYARYFTGIGSKEYSTLNDVKERLGLLDVEDEEEEEEENESEQEETPAAPSKPDPEPDPIEQQNAAIKAAESCIGKPLSALLNACGEPSGTTYENEPETGETGYHYYNGFTVSTTVDENGNEIVAGVW